MLRYEAAAAVSETCGPCMRSSGEGEALILLPVVASSFAGVHDQLPGNRVNYLHVPAPAKPKRKTIFNKAHMQLNSNDASPQLLRGA